ncbi:hypothetical protein F4821DRAFT_256465 [Hypoxylon rubiginosum]|uniref:Uncharacterized protein n=1 Tax=Hypoxylon rubiginosum TaxID=110542 RepID=A0ACC0DAZ1_9PEZI|nr:hypothetical protein F4821DRAFT_256465 [Hypoxylon rubiginosum]
MPDDSEATPVKSKASLDDLMDRLREERWCEAIYQYSKGYKSPEIFFPVIIRPTTFISSASKLQEYAELQSIPETRTITNIPDSPSEPTGEVTVCVVTEKEASRIRHKSEFEKVLVWFEDEERFAIFVISPKARDEGLGTRDEKARVEDSLK